MLSKFRTLFFSALGASVLGLSGCESQQPAATAAPAPAASAAAAPAKPNAEAVPAVEARYECPMGCAGSQSTKPGKCPTCEMELVKKA
jgi:hypothetical protein